MVERPLRRAFLFSGSRLAWNGNIELEALSVPTAIWRRCCGLLSQPIFPKRQGMRGQAGFSLIEIAMVVVIIGLLLGGILWGVSLIASAGMRRVMSNVEEAKVVYFGFLDRYRSLPGDYSLATTNIAGATVNGNGNGQIQSVLGGGTVDEHIAVWEHLSHAGFLNKAFTYAAIPETPGSAPMTLNGRYVQLIYDNAYGAGSGPMRHNFKTGNLVSSWILAEIDRKVDDGNPLGGVFQFSTYNGGTGGTSPGGAGTCYQAGPPPTWTATTVSNCGGASLF